MRGQVVVGAAPEGLSVDEELRRIEAAEHLLALGHRPDRLCFAPVGEGPAVDGGPPLDLAATTVPADEAAALPPDRRLARCAVVVAVARDGDRPGPAPVPDRGAASVLVAAPLGCRVVRWGDGERRVLWLDGVGRLRAGPLADLPPAGAVPVGAAPATLARLRGDVPLDRLFDQVEDVLHGHGVARQDRYEVMLHLLLAKLHDERRHAAEPDRPLAVQDHRALGTSVAEAERAFAELRASVVRTYGPELLRPLDVGVAVPPEAVADAMAVLAPHRVEASSAEAMQRFFMRFARDLYRWDMAQYFTPPPLTRFVVEAVAPGAEDLVVDPAAGSADFLMAAHARPYGRAGLTPRMVAVDKSATAAQVAELNKILHGASTCEVRVGDSLEGDERHGTFHVVVCNPPFGARIVERRPEVLERFDLGHGWEPDGAGGWRRGRVLARQEVGILFVEACVRLALAGPPGADSPGRVALVLPNGYLGNRAARFVVLRDWLVRHARVAAVVGFPRFTFKGSGADVSASVVFLERRAEPLARAADARDHPVAVELIDQVGWEAGVKGGGPTYRRDDDGAVVVGPDGEPVEDHDFDAALWHLRNSPAGEAFGWLAPEAAGEVADRGHVVALAEVVADPLRCLDPKRHSAKHRRVVAAVAAGPHLRLGDVATVLPELGVAAVRARPPRARFRYVEIGDVGAGTYAATDLAGWQLPSRARHGADPGDLFVGAIWGSVSKWFVAGPEEGLVVTNGFHRLRLHDPDGDALDVLAGLCTEAFAVQMRARARGSDGLAEVGGDDLAEVVLPRVTDPAHRARLAPLVAQVLAGTTTLSAVVGALAGTTGSPFPDVPPRPHHLALV